MTRQSPIPHILHIKTEATSSPNLICPFLLSPFHRMVAHYPPYPPKLGAMQVNLEPSPRNSTGDVEVHQL